VGEKGRYLYAVTRGVDTQALRGTVGLDDGPLDTLEEGGLTAVTGLVDLDEFGEEGLRVHLEDLAWLERVARRHDEVVTKVAGLGPTAPLRMATICHDDAGVRDRLREWHDALHAALNRVEGRKEWSVKAYAQPRPAAFPAPSTTTPQARSGAAYLQRKRVQTEHRQLAEEQDTAAAIGIHAALSGAAVASRLLAAQDPRLTGHEGTMVLNGAYLVDEEHAGIFVAETESQAATHQDVRVEVNGPWPPYSFATLDQP
jgi:hypothetical protein